MTNCVKCRFSLNLQLFSVVSKSAPVKYIAIYCSWDSHQIRSSCTSMSLWWQNNPSLWLSWTVSIPKWVPKHRHAACAPSDAKLLEGGVCVGKSTIIASDNGLSPDRRQAIIWTNAGILLIRSLGTNFSDFLSEIRAFSFKKMHLKMSSAK